METSPTNDVAVLFVCKFCRFSFQKLDQYIGHKKLKHFPEFQKTKCIVFEEQITGQNITSDGGDLADLPGCVPIKQESSLDGYVNSDNEIDDDDLPVEPIQLMYTSDDDPEDVVRNRKELHRTEKINAPGASSDASNSFFGTEFNLWDDFNGGPNNNNPGPGNTNAPPSTINTKRTRKKRPVNYNLDDNDSGGKKKKRPKTSKSKTSPATATKAERKPIIRLTAYEKKVASATQPLELLEIQGHKRNFQCEMCDRFFSTRAHLKNHIPTHFDIRPYKCPHPNCKSSFKTKGSLRQHKNVTHSDIKMHKCQHPNCSKEYKSRQKLSLHLRSHGSDQEPA